MNNEIYVAASIVIFILYVIISFLVIRFTRPHVMGTIENVIDKDGIMSWEIQVNKGEDIDIRKYDYISFKVIRKENLKYDEQAVRKS